MHRANRIMGKIVLLVLTIGMAGGVSYGEDFSVHLDRLITVDSQKKLPTYTVERKLKKTKMQTDGRTHSIWDVSIQLESDLSVPLDVCLEEKYPVGHPLWPKGVKLQHGLIDSKSVKVGWLKGSPDLLIVAWVLEPSRMGKPIYIHGYLILQLTDGKAKVLLRRRDRCGVDSIEGIHEDALQSTRFSWDTKAKQLVETIDRSYHVVGSSRLPLTRGYQTDVSFYAAYIHETIAIRYSLQNDKLVPKAASLVYTTQKNTDLMRDSLREITHFYLGPMAPRELLLKANPTLAKKHKSPHPGEYIYLPNESKVNIPVPAEWLIKKFGATGCAKRSLPPKSATQPAGKSEADRAAIWEAKVGKPITLEGFAVRGKDGVRLRHTGTGARCPYAMRLKIKNVFRDLRGGQGVAVRVTGTLQLDKHVWTKADVEKYHRDLASGYKQMQMRPHLKAGQVDRDFYISDGVVTRLATPTTKSTDVGKVSK